GGAVHALDLEVKPLDLVLLLGLSRGHGLPIIYPHPV
ncbi:hypothetical protein LCGC14_2475600, partial [marine sediment metagenome]